MIRKFFKNTNFCFFYVSQTEWPEGVRLPGNQPTHWTVVLGLIDKRLSSVWIFSSHCLHNVYFSQVLNQSPTPEIRFSSTGFVHWCSRICGQFHFFGLKSWIGTQVRLKYIWSDICLRWIQFVFIVWWDQTDRCLSNTSLAQGEVIFNNSGPYLSFWTKHRGKPGEEKPWTTL